jgi:hypothetical protein
MPLFFFTARLLEPSLPLHTLVLGAVSQMQHLYHLGHSYQNCYPTHSRLQHPSEAFSVAISEEPHQNHHHPQRPTSLAIIAVTVISVFATFFIFKPVVLLVEPGVVVINCFSYLSFAKLFLKVSH